MTFCLKTNAVQLEKIPDTSVWRPTRQNQEFLDQQSNAFQSSNKGAMEFPLVIDISKTVFFFTNIRRPTGYLSQVDNKNYFLLSPTEKPFTRGEVIDALKIVYGYCTGGLMINGDGDILTASKDDDLNPFSEIEHFFAWRSMINQGGHLPAPQRQGNTMESVEAVGHAGKPVKSTGRKHSASDICQTIDGIGLRDAALRVEYIIRNLRSDPYVYSNCFAEIQMQDLVKEMIKTMGDQGYAIVMEMLVSMERLAPHGMWWCCRLFNQLKLSASFFALLHKRTNNTLEFYCSKSRVRAVVNMMLCYIFDKDGKLYHSF